MQDFHKLYVSINLPISSGFLLLGILLSTVVADDPLHFCGISCNIYFVIFAFTYLVFFLVFFFPIRLAECLLVLFTLSAN